MLCSARHKDVNVEATAPRLGAGSATAQWQSLALLQNPQPSFDTKIAVWTPLKAASKTCGHPLGQDHARVGRKIAAGFAAQRPLSHTALKDLWPFSAGQAAPCGHALTTS